MTREEKIKLAIERGITYDEVTGKIYGVRGKEITSKVNGYVNMQICLDKKYYNVSGHQFAFYTKYNRLVDFIDHKDGDRSNNRIDNLREVTIQQNQHNRTTAKGYCFCKKSNKYRTTIKLNYKTIHIGYFKTEQEARQAYLDAKKIYHKV